MWGTMPDLSPAAMSMGLYPRSWGNRLDRRAHLVRVGSIPALAGEPHIAFQRIAVSRQLFDQAKTALELAQARYKVGLSGIVDLTQAQLAQTEAEIGYTNARYTYQIALAEVRFQTGQ